MKQSNYKRTQTRSKRGQFKGKTKDEKAPERVQESANDASWYTIAPQLVSDAASLSFNNPSGVVYTLDSGTHGKFVNPGIMSMYVAPVPGVSAGLSSAANIAAKNFYSFIRSRNSGGKNYDSPDILLYLMAMDSAYSFWMTMVRAYGMARVFVQSNRYFGELMLKASRIDFASISNNLANFRAYINQYALKLSALAVPATMSLFTRHTWMFGNAFADEDDTKAQFYMYVPAYFYKYEEYEGAGKCVPVPFGLDNEGTGIPHALWTFEQLMEYGNTLIGALIASEDINIMSGDIIKAYDNNTWKVNLIGEDFTILPVYKEEVLEQIHNTTFVGCDPQNVDGTRGWGSFAITQDASIGEGCLICVPQVTYGASNMARHVLDFWKQNPTPEDVMVATRNMVSATRKKNSTVLTSFGTEIPMFATVHTLNEDGTGSSTSMFNKDSYADWASRTVEDVTNRLSKLSYFNEHPHMLFADYTSDPNVYIRGDLCIGEMSNFTVVPESTLDKMHLTAVMSEFAIPYLGTLAK